MSRRRLFLTALTLLALALVLAVSGCSKASDGGAGASGEAASPAPVADPAPDKAPDEPKEPQYTSWTVYINDDDSYSQGPITYKIALNLTATNPSPDAAGTYTGNATASTSTNGTVSGAKGSGQLEANAIANSGTLEFKLQDTTAGGALGGITSETAGSALYSGKGTITMKAAGTASVNGASGGFANTSSQQIGVDVVGSKVTLKVNISGHTYTFEGTLTGKE